MWVWILLWVWCRTVIGKENVVFMGSVSDPGISTDSLFVAPAPSKIESIEFEDYIPNLDVDPGTYCTLGAALVKSLGFVPTIQLIYGEPQDFKGSHLFLLGVYLMKSFSRDSFSSWVPSKADSAENSEDLVFKPISQEAD